MQEEKTNTPKLVSARGAFIDLLLTLACFLFFTFIVLPKHVPGYTPAVVYTFAAYTSLCITGVFWISLNLFRVTLVDQLIRRKQR